MIRTFSNWRGLLPVVAVVAMANLIPAASHAQITFLNTWGSPGSGNTQFNFPLGMAVGPTGMVYVVDTNNQRVQVFNSAGVYQSTIGTTGSAGTGNNQFNSPDAVAVDPSGTVYVSDTDNQRVQVFNSAGIYQSTIGTTGSAGTGNNQFNSPLGMAVGPAGTVYIADELNERVQVFNSAGVYQNTIGTTGNLGTGNNQLHSPDAVAVGPSGTVYIADELNFRVQVFNSTGVYESTMGTTASPGSGDNQFDSPKGVAVGPTGMVYVADSSNQRVQVFNSAGVYQSTIGTGFGSGNNQFNSPASVAVGSTGMVYVADVGNQRIVRYFDPNSWVSGTNTFTDATTGPTSVVVGPSQMMGTSLTLTSAMGLTVGSAVSVNSGGFLTLSGGTLTAPSGLAVNSGGSFSYQTGSLSIGEISVSGFFQAPQGGQLSAPTGVAVGDPGEMLLDGGTSLTCGTVSMQGGLMVLANAMVSVTSANPFRIFFGEVQLQNANTSIINTPQLLNEGGLLDGSGRINGQLQNYLGAEVSVAAGQSMTITGAGNVNNGLMSLTGGTFHFTQDLMNNGALEGIGTLRVDGGLTNNGTLSLAGSSYVFGAVNNTSSGTIHLSGSTPNIFFGAINNNGTVNIDAGSSGLFYGGLAGSGNVTNFGHALLAANSMAGAVSGTGSLDIESPATLNANTVSQGGLSLQLGGDTAGTYSKLNVAGALGLAGKLTVSLVDGFAPALGNRFDLLDWGSLSGHFSSISLPALSSGLAWSSMQLYTTGTLAVVSSNLLPGDFNRDGHVDAADILSMETALVNLPSYQTAKSLSGSQLLAIGDLNGDGIINNADLQMLLIDLKAGEGSADPVPEPTTNFALALGGMILVVFARTTRTAA